MQVSTSNSGRASGEANRTPLVAITGTRNAAARSQQRLVVRLLVAQEVALQFDVDVVAAERAHDPIEQAADAVVRRRRPPARPDQRDQPAGLPVEILEREHALALRRPQLRARDEAAQVADSRPATRRAPAAVHSWAGRAAPALPCAAPEPDGELARR